MTPFINFSALRASLAIGVIVLSAAAPAQAVVYDFKKTGGPGGTVGSGSDIFVEVTENLSTVANDVLFKFTSELPIYNPSNLPSISRLYFDTGSYTSLFSGSLSITETSGLVNLFPKTPAPHPFLPLAPDYQFGLSNTFPLDNPINGINPGEYAVVAATLGGSNTFSDVISAMIFPRAANREPPARSAAGIRPQKTRPQGKGAREMPPTAMGCAFCRRNRPQKTQPRLGRIRRNPPARTPLQTSSHLLADARSDRRKRPPERACPVEGCSEARDIHFLASV